MAKSANDNSSGTPLLQRTLKDAVYPIYKVLIFIFGKRRLAFRRHLPCFDLIQHLQPELTIFDHPSLLFVVVEVYAAFRVACIMTFEALLRHQRAYISLIAYGVLTKR
jgi:hypothetical protein